MDKGDAAQSRSGPASFGYERRDGRLMAHPTEAPVRRRIFELFAEHRRKKTVAEILNADGLRTRGGAPFSGTTIGRLLEDERVVGVEGQIDALISRELFDRCAAILDDQQKHGVTRSVVHLFAGYVFCRCGEKMYVPSGSDKYVCQACRNKIPADDLEAVFVALVGQAQPAAENAPTEEQKLARWVERVWHRLSPQDKRSIIESLTERVEIGDKSITCSLVAL